MPRRLASPHRSHPRHGHYPHAPRGPLSRAQKAALCLLAREAFAVVFGHPPETPATLDTWRHAEQRQAIGLDSLRTAGQHHYRPLLAHFLHLKGESGRAFDLLRAEQTSELDLAKAKLRAACTRAGKTWAYAEAICKHQHRGLTIDELRDPRPIWRLVFTLTSRRHAAHRRQRSAPAA